MTVLAAAKSFGKTDLQTSPSFGALFKANKLVGLGAVGAFGLYGYNETTNTDTSISWSINEARGMKTYKLGVPLNADPRKD